MVLVNSVSKYYWQTCVKKKKQKPNENDSLNLTVLYQMLHNFNSWNCLFKALSRSEADVLFWGAALVTPACCLSVCVSASEAQKPKKWWMTWPLHNTQFLIHTNFTIDIVLCFVYRDFVYGLTGLTGAIWPEPMPSGAWLSARLLLFKLFPVSRLKRGVFCY